MHRYMGMSREVYGNNRGVTANEFRCCVAPTVVRKRYRVDRFANGLTSVLEAANLLLEPRLNCRIRVEVCQQLLDASDVGGAEHGVA